MDLSIYLDLFIAEAREHIGSASELAAQSRADDAGLSELFRHVHSVKGMAASMGFSAMSSLAHDAESLMDLWRQGRVVPQTKTRHILSDALACLERMVDRAESKLPVDDTERAPIQDQLQALLREAGGGTPDKPAADPGGSARPAGTTAPASPAGCVKVALIVRRGPAFPAVRAAVVLGRLGKLGRLVRIEPPMAALRTGRFDGRLLVTLISELTLTALAGKVAALEEVDSFTLVPAVAPPERVVRAAGTASLRVKADRLDAIIEDVLELMTSIGRLDAGLASHASGSPLSREAEAARLLARRAYDGLVDMRLVPFEIAAQRLERAASELSRKLGKPVRFEVLGQDVRIDRSLLERLIDPLLHMVRNAVGHGLESAEARRAACKTTTGTLRVTVVRSASRLSIIVEDDGAGLDPRVLKQAAIERGLLTPLEAARMADADAVQLITQPGFTTAAETTEVSGRGVGMDVVRNAIEGVGGRLRIDGRPGRGARFELQLPPTVALLQSYLVRSSGVLFAIPLSALKRMAPMDDQATTWREGRRYWNVGSEDVPVWALSEVLGLSSEESPAGMALITDSAAKGLVGIEVDEVVGRREMVVRPLPTPLTSLPGYSGAAVLDDGSIVLVLDPVSLPLG